MVLIFAVMASLGTLWLEYLSYTARHPLEFSVQIGKEKVGVFRGQIFGSHVWRRTAGGSFYAVELQWPLWGILLGDAAVIAGGGYALLRVRTGAVRGFAVLVGDERRGPCEAPKTGR